MTHAHSRRLGKSRRKSGAPSIFAMPTERTPRTLPVNTFRPRMIGESGTITYSTNRGRTWQVFELDSGRTRPATGVGAK